MAKKRRTQRPDAPAAAVVDEAPQPTHADHDGRDWGFAPEPRAASEPVDERALHALVRQWRHGRATRSLGDVLADAYVAVFALVMIGAMVVNVLLNSQRLAPGCDTAACHAGRSLVPWGVAFAIGALALSTARLFGPVVASAAEGFWLLDAPIRRAPVLRGRLAAVVAVPVVVGAALAAGVAAVAGQAPLTIVAWAAACGLGAAGLVAWAAWEQSHDRTRRLRVGQLVLTTLAAALLTAMVAASAGWITVVLPAWAALVPWCLAAAGGVAAVVFWAGARRRLEQFARTRLTSGGSLVSGLQGAMFALDLGLARDILVDREAIVRGHVRPSPGRRTGPGALVWRDAQRLARSPRPLVGVAGAVLATYASDAVGLSLLTPLLAALALMVALIPMLGALRVLSRTRGLARAFPFSTATLRTACATVPGLVALGWALACLPAFAGVTGGVPRDLPTAGLVALSCGLAGLLAAVRWQTAQPPNFDTPMMATSAGALPPTLIFNLIRGIDVAVLVTAPLLLGASPLWSIGLGLAVAGLLRGFDMAEMAEEAKEQQKALEAARAGRS